MTSRLLPLLALATLALAGCAGTSLVPTEKVVSTLAPTGKLRVGVYPGSASSMIKDPATTETKGLTYDLGKELAKRLGVPFQPVVYPRLTEVLAALKAGDVDVTIASATAVRARDMDFSPTIVDVQLGYLAPAGSRVAAIADLDRAGIRIGVSQGGTSQAVLAREMKHATIVPVPTMGSAIGMLQAGTLEAFATNKAVLHQMADVLPGAKVLRGGWGVEHFAFAIPKGREAGLAFVAAYAQDIHDKRFLALAVERAGLRGAAIVEQ